MDSDKKSKKVGFLGVAGFFLGVGIVLGIFAGENWEDYFKPQTAENAAHQEEEGDHRHEGEEGHVHEEEEGDHQEEGEEDHVHEMDSIALSDEALFNIGIGSEGTLTLTPSDYPKTFRIPGTVRAIPGRSINDVTSAVSGIVTRIEQREGDVLCPGAPLLKIMLTHEDAVTCQTELIGLLQKRDLLQMEEDRLRSLSEGLAPKDKREILLQKIANDAAIASQRNLLKIHGLTDEMIDQTIIEKRQAITHLIIRVPDIAEDGIETPTQELHSVQDDQDHYLVLEKLAVEKGDSVQIGDKLAQISDFRTLRIEGRVFANDENIVNRALLDGSEVTAVFPDPVSAGKTETIRGLTLHRIDNTLDENNQTLSVWLPLTNLRLENEGLNLSEKSPKTIRWRFKPGQRCELGIYYETIPDVFVLPPEAVAIDQSRAWVFELTPIHEEERVWTKRAVRVLYRAGDAVVIAPDEKIRAGMKIAAAGADQLLIAMGGGSGKLQSACGHNHSH